MKQKTTSAYLENEVALLVQHFGVAHVRAALAKALNGAVSTSEDQVGRSSIKTYNHHASPSITNMLEQLRQKDDEKYLLLTDFYTNLKNRKVLPESQDIRFFAQLIGLKEISGKSRNDMIPGLMRFLFEQSTERLRDYVKKAAHVSEQQRQQGYSILTEKLLSDK